MRFMKILLLMILIGHLFSTFSIAEDRDFGVEEVSDGLFVHFGKHEDMTVENRGDIANIGFVIGQESVAVIDPGGSAAVATALREAIEQRTNLPIEYLVLTHTHPDHVLGAGVFADVPHIIAHQRYRLALAFRTEQDTNRFHDLKPDRAAAAPTVELDSGMSTALDLGDRLLQVVAMSPGHTDHDVIVVDTNSATLWASDVIFGTRLPSLDGNLKGWLSVLEQVETDYVVDQVVPGHGPVAPLAQLLSPQREYLVGLRDRVREQIRAGRSLSDATKDAEQEASEGRLAGSDAANGWLLAPLHHPINVTQAWIQLEWE